MRRWSFYLFLPAILLVFAASVSAGSLDKDISVSKGAVVTITNRYGKIDVHAVKPDDSGTTKCTVTAASERPLQERELSVVGSGGKINIEVRAGDPNKRIDLTLTLPERAMIVAETNDGAVSAVGNFAEIDASTVLGTLAVDVPLGNLKYDFRWTAAHPRYVSDIDLAEVKEKAAGQFVLKGETAETTSKRRRAVPVAPDTDLPQEGKTSETIEPVTLRLTTERGIILLNVPPNEVASDLRDRPLTKAAKAIIRSGDSLLAEAIRRAAPKYYADYLKTLPPVKGEPAFATRAAQPEVPMAEVKRALVRVIDANNRTVSNLTEKDFTVTESGEEREIVSVEKVTAPVNLVLLLDVSGSVENYETFIRKAARNFVNTVAPNDRICIVTFNDDVKQLSGFSIDKKALSESLDTFEAGGGTAYYDALAYTLADVLRPLRGERTAIVVLTDGDDNRSFLAFDSLAGSIQESGALIYPLYVPSSLIAASLGDLNASLDPLRSKYMGLTTKAATEGPKLAQLSGGTYYQISMLSQIQAAYEDIAAQLRTAYFVTYRGRSNTGRSPKLKIRTNHEGTSVMLTSVTAVNGN